MIVGSADTFKFLAPYFEQEFFGTMWFNMDKPRNKGRVRHLEGGTALRLDFEIADDVQSEVRWVRIKKMMAAQMGWDVADLIVSGDRNNGSEVLLKNLDGELVLNKRLVGFEHGGVGYHVNHSSLKGMFEYSVFFSIKPEFA